MVDIKLGILMLLKFFIDDDRPRRDPDADRSAYLRLQLLPHFQLIITEKEDTRNLVTILQGQNDDPQPHPFCQLKGIALPVVIERFRHISVPQFLCQLVDIHVPVIRDQEWAQPDQSLPSRMSRNQLLNHIEKVVLREISEINRLLCPAGGLR